MKRRRESEGGWSLPLTPILLVAIVALIYFFGWIGLAIPLAAAAALTLGTFVYDRCVASRSPVKSCFWFHSHLELLDLWKLVGGTDPFRHDAENVWEWIGAEVGEDPGRYHLSLSRKTNDPVHPVQVTLTHQENPPTPEMLDELGRRFAAALRTEVKFGTVEYVGGNDFTFTEQKSFRPAYG